MLYLGLILAPALLASTPATVQTKQGAKFSLRRFACERSCSAGPVLVVPGPKTRKSDIDTVVKSLRSRDALVWVGEYPDGRTISESDLFAASVTWVGKTTGKTIDVFAFGSAADAALTLGTKRAKEIGALIVDHPSEAALKSAARTLRKVPHGKRDLIVLLRRAATTNVVMSGGTTMRLDAAFKQRVASALDVRYGGG